MQWKIRESAKLSLNSVTDEENLVPDRKSSRSISYSLLHS